MKTTNKLILVSFLIFVLPDLVFSQQVENPQEVFVENEWYLTKLVIDGEDRPFIPDGDVSNVYLKFDNVVLNEEEITGAIETYFCEADWAQFTLEGGEDLYTEGWNTLSKSTDITNCGLEPITDNRATESLYFDVFWMNNANGTNENYHHHYTINQVETAKELIITNDDGNMAYFHNTPLSVQDFEKDKLVLYPNPIEDRLYIENLTQNVQMEIYNLSGRKLLKENLNNSFESVYVSQLSKGVYLYKLSRSGKSIKTGKLVKN